MPINKCEVTEEMFAKALQCKTVEELMELAKAAGKDITREEAEAYFLELEDVELDKDALKNVSGGNCYMAGCKN